MVEMDVVARRWDAVRLNAVGLAAVAASPASRATVASVADLAARSADVAAARICLRDRHLPAGPVAALSALVPELAFAHPSCEPSLASQLLREFSSRRLTLSHSCGSATLSRFARMVPSRADEVALCEHAPARLRARASVDLLPFVAFPRKFRRLPTGFGSVGRSDGLRLLCSRDDLSDSEVDQLLAAGLAGVAEGFASLFVMASQLPLRDEQVDELLSGCRASWMPGALASNRHCTKSWLGRVLPVDPNSLPARSIVSLPAEVVAGALVGVPQQAWMAAWLLSLDPRSAQRAQRVAGHMDVSGVPFRTLLQFPFVPFELRDVPEALFEPLAVLAPRFSGMLGDALELARRM